MRHIACALFALACLLLVPDALADGGFAAAPSVLTESGALDTLLSIDADGRAACVWREQGTTQGIVESRIWRWVEGDPSPTLLAGQTLSHTLAIDLIPGGQGRYVGWTVTKTRTHTANRLDLLTSDQPLRIDYPRSYRHAEMLDRQGHLHAIWAERDALVYINTRQAITLTVPLTGTLEIGELLLATDAAGQAHVAWQMLDALGAPAELYYAPVLSGTVATLISPRSMAPQMALGPSGEAHLLWRDETGWRYATSADWTAQTPRDGLLADTATLAVGPGGEAYVVWDAGDSLRYTCSLAWESDWRMAALPQPLNDLALAIDGCGGLHLAWTDLLEGEPGAAYYLAGAEPEPQLAAWFTDWPHDGRVTTAVAESNLSADEIDHVAFYLQRDTGLESETPIELLELGVDADGADGWRLPVDGSRLAYGRYRLYAIAATTSGQMLRANGAWFSASDPTVWMTYPTSRDPALARQAFVEIGVAPETELSAQVGFYLAPVGADAAVERLSLGELLEAPRFVGVYAPTAARVEEGIYRLAFDSRQVPDGRYVAVLMLIDDDGAKRYVPLMPPLEVDNLLAPSVQWRSPQGDESLSGEMLLTLDADDVDGHVERVAFYLDRALDDDDAVPEAWRRVWLGADDDGSDGWALLRSIDPTWEGGQWCVRAQAFDDQGHATEAVSASVITLASPEAPLVHFVEPWAGQVLRQEATVTLEATRNAAQIRGIALYLVDSGGTLYSLGRIAVAQETERWTTAFDTTQWPDGHLELLALVTRDSGGQVLSLADAVVDNAPSLQMKGVSSSAVLGPEPLLISLDAQPSDEGSASFWLESEDGRLLSLGADHEASDGLGILLRPCEWLDGSYRLLAQMQTADGKTVWSEQRVTLHSHTPTIRLTQRPVGRGLSGVQSLNWEATHPQNEPLSVALALSCDDGQHWMPIASELPAVGPWRWSTVQWPDTASARLRLTVSDGTHQSEVVSPRFGLSNRNAAPWAQLLSPVPDQDYSQVMRLSWRAGDAESLSELQVAIEYRQGQGRWVPLFDGLNVAGSRDWNISALTPGDDYALRVVVTDPQGATAGDLVENVSIVANRAPTVRLLWPEGRIALEDEVVILWQATDPDGDRLAIDLYYSYDAGYTWFPLAEDVANSGFYEWQLAFLPASDQYRLRVVARDEQSRASDESQEVMTAGRRLSQYVTLSDPPDGALLSGRHLIRWQSRASAGATVQLRLEAQDASFTRDLVTEADGSGVLLWNTAIMPDGHYTLIATVTDDSGSTARIKREVTVANSSGGTPGIALESPMTGALLAGRHLVSWRLTVLPKTPLTATVEVRPLGSDSWQMVGLADAALGRYLWDTRRLPSGRYYRLRVGLSPEDEGAEALVYLADRGGMPPALRMISPGSDGTLLQGDTVAWLAQDPDGDVLSLDLAASSDGGITWQTLANGLHDTGEFRLRPGLLPEGTHLLRLMTRDALHGLETVAQTRTVLASTEQAPTLAIVQPTRWDTVHGEIRIAWEARDPYGAIPRVHIELSADGGSSWQTLARNLEREGEYRWDSEAWPNGSYYVRFTADNGRFDTQVIKGPFAVDNPSHHAPVVSLVTPQGGERWDGHRQLVWSGWDADSDALSYSIAYRVEGEMAWRTLARDLGEPRYLLDSSVMPNTGRAWLRVTASDGLFQGRAQSLDPLIVANPRTSAIRLLQPGAGQQAAGAVDVVWEATRGDVSLAYSLDDGGYWLSLANGLDTSGSYHWDLGSCRYRRGYCSAPRRNSAPIRCSTCWTSR